jgi:hypothetical protein
MNLTKRLAPVVILGSTFASAAFGADAVATKAAPASLSLFPETKVAIEVRHNYNVFYNEQDEITKKPVKMMYRPVLTSDWFHGKFTSILKIGLQKTTDENRFTVVQPELFVTRDFSIAEVIGVSPYASIYLPHLDKAANGSVGSEVSVSKEFATVAGTFTPSFSVDPSVDVGAKPSDRTVIQETRNEFGLAETKTVVQKGAEEDPSYTIGYQVGTGYKVPVYTKWSVNAYTRVEDMYSPEHKLVGQRVETSYASQRGQSESVSLKYQANAALSFTNETRVYDKVMQQTAAAGVGLHNRFVMNYKL